MKIVAVHGIQQENKWYETLQAMEKVKEEKLTILPYNYGYFSGFKFSRKSKRQNIVDGFAKFYSDNFKSNESLPSVIAHSFGTAVIFHAMDQYDVIKFDTIILCGSILNSKIDLRKYFNSGQIKHIVNDCGDREWFVKFSWLLSREYGQLGKIGFQDIPPQFKDCILNRQSQKSHSDYFLPKNMEVNWIDYLLKLNNKLVYDHRILRKDVIDRVYKKSFNGEFEINNIQFNARIDRDGNYYAKYHAKGINNSNKSIENYLFTTSADGIHDISTMNFRIYDEDNNILLYDIIEDFNHNKIIKIRFNSNVTHKTHIDQRVYFCWYNTINLDKGDTDHWNVQNIRNVSIQLNFPRQLKSAKFISVINYKLKESISATHIQEIDNSHTYSLIYVNDKNVDGFIFYFEGQSDDNIKHNAYRPFMPSQIVLGKKKVVHCEIAKLEDISKIYRIETEIEHSNAATEDTLRKRLLMFNDGFLVIKDRKNNQILAYIETLIWNDKDFVTFEEISNFPIHYNIRGTSLYIIFLATSKSYRKKGFGTKLLKEIENQAKQFGVKLITLVAKDDLVSFYSKLGFKEDKTLPDFLANRDYKSVKMKKEL
jgi:ribosomal protein S18 acetylase RimI-like enzyme